MNGSDWDAATYHRVADPQESWALELLERVPLRGDETVLDAGCGSGRVTRLLIDRLPAGRVIGVDSSPAMVDAAREVLRPQDRAVLADLTELELDERADVVFSNAVFHWIADHDLLFRRLHAALRPGGLLAAQCGGQGNVARFREVMRELAESEPFAAHLRGVGNPWNFASTEETTRRLEAAGFAEVSCWLEERPVSPREPREYLRAACLCPYFDRLPAELHDELVDRALERLAGGEWSTTKLNVQARSDVELGYVRLNLAATRSG